MSDTPAEEPQSKPNLLKPERLSAYQAAQDAVDDVAPGGANPLEGAGTSIMSGAWESPVAADFVTDLAGEGTTLKSKFIEAESHLETEYTSEPDTVLVPGPQEWKADARSLRIAGF